MITKTVEEVRTGWGPLVDAVLASDDPHHPSEREEVAIARIRGRPAEGSQAAELIAVIVPIGWYTSIPADQRPPETEVQVLKSVEARAGLRDVLLAAGRGMHTAITFYGKQRAVVVPHAWHQQHAS